MSRTAHIYWATEEMGEQVEQMAADDMDSVSRFISKLVAAEIERRSKQRADRLVDSRAEYDTKEIPNALQSIHTKGRHT